MRLGWVKSLSLFLGLMTLLSACQPGPSSRSYARTSAFTSDHAAGYRSGCGSNPCGAIYSRPHCPPGYILGRIPYAYGGPGRYCVPHYGRLSRCDGPRPSPCGDGRYRSRYY